MKKLCGKIEEGVYIPGVKPANEGVYINVTKNMGALPPYNGDVIIPILPIDRNLNNNNSQETPSKECGYCCDEYNN